MAVLRVLTMMFIISGTELFHLGAMLPSEYIRQCLATSLVIILRIGEGC